MIRIGFDGRWFNTSGVGTYVGNLLDGFGKLQDDDFEIIAYEHANNPIPIENPRVKKCLVAAPKYSPMEQAELAYRCTRDKLDVFHAPFYITPIFTPCPVISTIHDLMAFLFPIYGRAHLEIVKAGYRSAVWKSKYLIAISDRTRIDLESMLKVPPSKIRRIYNAYSKNLYHEYAASGEREYLRERYGLVGDYVMTLSATNWRTKNLQGAMRALAAAEERSGSPFQSVIAGPAEGYHCAGLTGLIRNEVLTGFVPNEDLPKLYRHAAAFLSVSFYEGFGAPLMEAMGCGCPTIVSNGGSLPEIAGGAATVFECDDIQGMAGEVIRLLSDKEYRQRRREQGIARAKEFSYTKSAEQTLELYREVAEARH